MGRNQTGLHRVSAQNTGALTSINEHTGERRNFRLMASLIIWPVFSIFLVRGRVGGMVCSNDCQENTIKEQITLSSNTQEMRNTLCLPGLPGAIMRSSSFS